MSFKRSISEQLGSWGIGRSKKRKAEGKAKTRTKRDHARVAVEDAEGVRRRAQDQKALIRTHLGAVSSGAAGQTPKIKDDSTGRRRLSV